ncbi:MULTISPECIES: sulfotransferase family protein [Mameliella]|uniref:sulfotransferase family protein n=1 Tax=Mameliella TaxID=1434019 RepID=UPI000B529F5E|nr:MULTISPECIES: sulfotransferase [Mameliella]MCR9276256.1 sulfotransferase [Paracoccaceae bacterium]OWV61637.1 hypothetical protein CDZ98_03795 [Mameliella alba]
MQWPWAKTRGDGPVTSDGKSVVLVTGAPRSGTTALVELLNCHPELAVTNERYNKRLLARDLRLEHYSVDRMRRYQPDDGGKVSFEMDVTQKALAKLDGARVVGDKIPRPYEVFELAQTLGKAPVIAILREPMGMARSYMGRVRRAEMQMANGKTPTWPVKRDFHAAVRDFNDYVALLRDMSASKLGGSAPWLLVEYVSLFSGEYPVERIFEFLDLDPAKATGLDAVVGVREEKQRKVDELDQFVGLNADFVGYREVFDRVGPAGKDIR